MPPPRQGQTADPLVCYLAPNTASVKLGSQTPLDVIGSSKSEICLGVFEHVLAASFGRTLPCAQTRTKDAIRHKFAAEPQFVCRKRKIPCPSFDSQLAAELQPLVPRRLYSCDKALSSGGLVPVRLD